MYELIVPLDLQIKLEYRDSLLRLGGGNHEN